MSISYFKRKMAFGSRGLRMLVSPDGELSHDMKRLLFNEYVEIINLELSSQCNRKCDYCPVASTPGRQSIMKLMEIGTLEKTLADLTQIRYSKGISLNLYNEPLLDAGISDKVRLIKHSLPLSNVGFNSNGDRLDRKTFQDLALAGLDYLIVTLHPPPNKSQTARTIARRISGLLNRIGLGGELNVPIDIYSRSSIETTFKGVRFKLQWPDWRTTGTNRGGSITLESLNRRERFKPCLKPFREFTIYWDGAVLPCCEVFYDGGNHPLKFGDLSRDCLFDIYASRVLRDFRATLCTFGPKMGVCRHCISEESAIDTEPEDHFRAFGGFNRE